MKGVLNLLDRKVLLSRLHSTIVHNIVLRHKSLRGMALYFFRCKNLGVLLICNYIVRQFDHVILRGRYNFSADIHCYSDFPDLRHLTLRGMQQNLSKIATSTCTCREIKSSMIRLGTDVKSNYVLGHIWLVLFSKGTGRAVHICPNIFNQQMF